MVMGTVQLGLDYGVANVSGKPRTEDALRLLETAWYNGVNFFDTAPAYGNSEELLGEFIKNSKGRNREVNIITKIPGSCPEKDVISFVEKSVTQSLCKIGIERIEYYLLHESKDVENRKLIDALFALKSKGLITEPGASIYSLNEAEIAIQNGLKVLQVPVSIFDQRFLDKHLLDKCKKYNVTLLSRSVLLQGLFFIKPQLLPATLSEAKPYLEDLYSICEREGLSTQELALNFVQGFSEIDHILVGVENIEQLYNNLRAFEGAGLSMHIKDLLMHSFKNVPEKIYDPRIWER